MKTGNTLRIIRYSALALLVVLTGLISYQLIKTQLAKSEGELIAGVAFKGQYQIINAKTKQVVNQSDFYGRPQALYFGFTHCPDVCPTTLADMDIWIEALGEDASKIHFAFISVDPERDSLELLSAYVSNFSPLIEVYGGEQDEITNMLKTYRIYAEKVFDEEEEDPMNYTMDHTASVLLLDNQSRFIGTIAYLEDQKSAIAKLKRLANSTP